MKTNYKNFELTANFIGDKECEFIPGNYNYYKIIVKNTESKKRTSFDYWCSIMHPEIETEEEILEAFSCWLNDATAGTYDIDEFYNEFCYDGEIKQAVKAWRGCQKAYKKAARVIGDIETIYDLLNEIDY